MSPRYQNPALTVDAVWVRAGKVLLVRRGLPPFKGSWAFPGGFVELREKVEEAVVREVREETGLTVRPGPIVGVYSGPDRDPRKPTASVVFLVRGRGGVPVGSDDAATAEWVPLARARPLAFDHSKILADALRLLKRGRPRQRRRTPRTRKSTR